MRAVPLIAVALALPSAAHGQPASVRDLVEIVREMDATCRGTSPDEVGLLERVCESRDRLAAAINRRGWCYGKRGQIGANMRWHVCGPTSQRQP